MGFELFMTLMNANFSGVLFLLYWSVEYLIVSKYDVMTKAM
jgi:hypothetical protein